MFHRNYMYFEIICNNIKKEKYVIVIVSHPKVQLDNEQLCFGHLQLIDQGIMEAMKVFYKHLSLAMIFFQ